MMTVHNWIRNMHVILVHIFHRDSIMVTKMKMVGKIYKVKESQIPFLFKFRMRLKQDYTLRDKVNKSSEIRLV